MLTLSIALLAAKPATVAGEPAIVTAFISLCRPGSRSASDVLTEATAKGWHGDGADRTMTAAGAVLTLHAADTENHGELLRSCGIRTTATIPAIAAAARMRLGFAPALDLGTSATFFAIGDAGGWRSGAALDRAQFAAAKAQGTFYSIVAAADEAGSTMYAAHAIPEQPTSAPR